MQVNVTSPVQTECESPDPKEQKAPGTSTTYENMGNLESQQNGSSIIEWKNNNEAEKPNLRSFLRGMESQDNEEQRKKIQQQHKMKIQEQLLQTVKTESNVSDSQEEYRKFIEKQKAINQEKIIALKKQQMDRIKKEKVMQHQEHLQRMCVGPNEPTNQERNNQKIQVAQSQQKLPPAQQTSVNPAPEIVRKRKPGRPPGSTKKSRIVPPETNIPMLDTNDFSLRQFFEAGGRDYKDYLEWMQKKALSSAVNSRAMVTNNNSNNSTTTINNSNQNTITGMAVMKQQLIEKQGMTVTTSPVNQSPPAAMHPAGYNIQGGQITSMDQKSLQFPHEMPPNTQIVPQNIQTPPSPISQGAVKNAQMVPQNSQIMGQNSHRIQIPLKIPSAPSTPRSSSVSSEHSISGNMTPPFSL